MGDEVGSGMMFSISLVKARPGDKMNEMSARILSWGEDYDGEV